MTKTSRRTAYDSAGHERCNRAYDDICELLGIQPESEGLGTYPPNGLYVSVKNAEQLIELARKGKESTKS